MLRRCLIALSLVFAAPAQAQLPPSGGLVINQTPISGGTTNQCLYVTSAGKVGNTACGGSPSGAAGGVLSGTYPNPGFATPFSLPGADTRIGGADAAAPVSQTMTMQSVVTGTTDTAGASLTIKGSQGTGTGVGGPINFQFAPNSTTGNTPNALVTRFTIANAGILIQNAVSGGLGINNSALTGYGLRNSWNMVPSGTTGIGIAVDGIIQSGVTNSAIQFYSRPTTAAASFTISNLNHFRADPGTFGAGSTVTNQQGFIAASTLTAATNNYGFYGDIALGTGRFNFYANGTAANRFNGDLLIYGGTAIPAGGTAGSGYKFSSATNFGVFFGSGVPTLSAAKGSLYLRSDGTGAADRAYINTDGATTWTNLVTAL